MLRFIVSIIYGMSGLVIQAMQYVRTFDNAVDIHMILGIAKEIFTKHMGRTDSFVGYIKYLKKNLNSVVQVDGDSSSRRTLSRVLDRCRSLTSSWCSIWSGFTQMSSEISRGRMLRGRLLRGRTIKLAQPQLELIRDCSAIPEYLILSF